MGSKLVLLLFSLLVFFVAALAKEAHKKTPKEDTEMHEHGFDHKDLLEKIKEYRAKKELDIKNGRSERTDWNGMARKALKEALEKKLNNNIAKNVIVFIGDGMGLTSLTAARIMAGHESNITEGEANYLSFEKFPFSAQSKTYNADWQAGDSAACATAILSGEKTPFLTIGVNESAWQFNCTSVKGNEIESVIRKANKAGKATGIVTTTRVTHATPAAAYAHSAARYWEHDGDLFPWDNPNECVDHARQLLDNGIDMDVVMGGGRSFFLPESEDDPVDLGRTGDREDGRHLINEWLANKTQQGRKPQTAYTLDQLEDLDLNQTDAILGLFRRGHMSYHRSRNADAEPSLTQMTAKAIELLSKKENGYVMMVESGRIDVAHHGGRAWLALTDTIEFANAVDTAARMTNEEDTLIIVTADHSHTFTFGGYHFRGTKVMGKAIYPSFRDFMPYTKVTYGLGPGFNHTAGPNGREDLTGQDTDNPWYVPQSAVPMGSGTHGGEDVGIYSRGPMAHLLQGVQEQHYIAHVVQYAGCFGDYANNCPRSGTNSQTISTHLPNRNERKEKSKKSPRRKRDTYSNSSIQSAGSAALAMVLSAIAVFLA